MVKGSVLITGANGFVGKNLAAALKKTRPVHCLVRDKSFTMRGCRSFFFDRVDDEEVERAVSSSEKIVHCAAMLHGPKEGMHLANVAFTERLVALARRHGAAQFIFISSENVLQGLSDTYTKTKRDAEEVVGKFTPHTVLRPTVIYGPGDTKYVSRLIGIVRRYPVVPVLGRGRNRFQFLYIGDLLRVVESAIDGPVFGTYLIAGPKSISYNDFMALLFDLLGKKKPVVRVPLFLLRPLTILLDRVSDSPTLTPTQIDNIKKDRDYDIGDTVSAFGYVPTPLREGLLLLLSGECV
ncbi:MAG: NAD-dependent epimerase/dehydratase family protein [Spirochaetes bacterium]|nr:NAD-dependent epimerase/dehydratase family protein [Spirochaetota bacterium]